MAKTKCPSKPTCKNRASLGLQIHILNSDSKIITCNTESPELIRRSHEGELTKNGT
jgi:hypothetical protein